MKLFLSPEFHEQDFIRLFSEYGSSSNGKIVCDISNQMSRGFGFVDRPLKVDAKKALKILNDLEFNGRRMSVNEVEQGHDRNSAGNQKKFNAIRTRFIISIKQRLIR